MALYGLTDSELFWDQGSDTKMLMAWSRTCVVCAFRGTASLSNAMSDLQVCRLLHVHLSSYLLHHMAEQIARGAAQQVCKLMHVY